ncbi:MAG: sulfatase-like hydrolase/transferase [Candidatus Brocadiia bacterium]
MPPNLLFLYTDEQRFDTMGAYGNRRIETPNLDRLAETSTVFDEAYVTQPVCTPSRSTLLTGLYPHTNGCLANNVPLPADVPCLPQILPRGVYATAHHGKWHLGDEIFPQHGFQHWRAIEDMYRGYYSPGRCREKLSHYQRWLQQERGVEPPEGSDHLNRSQVARLPEELSKPAYLAQEASRFIRANRGRPFVLYVNFLEPHMPFTGPRDGQYDPAEVPLPDNFEAAPGPAQPLKARSNHLRWSSRFETEEDWRALIARYWGLCSQVDTHVGTILDALEECGLTDETIVVYTSDHGDMMGSHQLAAKTVMYQEAVRVPLMVRLPGQTEGRRVRGPVSQIDLVPTLLDLMGAPLPDHLEGKSLRAALTGEVEALTEDIFIEWNGVEGYDPKWQVPGADEQEVKASYHDPVRTIITPDGWRFSCSPLGEHELYNLREDPGETVNLAMQEQHRPVMRELCGHIAAWQERTADHVELPEL